MPGVFEFFEFRVAMESPGAFRYYKALPVAKEDDDVLTGSEIKRRAEAWLSTMSPVKYHFATQLECDGLSLHRESYPYKMGELCEILLFGAGEEVHSFRWNGYWWVQMRRTLGDLWAPMLNPSVLLVLHHSSPPAPLPSSAALLLPR